jgi:hypothetical protein
MLTWKKRYLKQLQASIAKRWPQAEKPTRKQHIWFLPTRKASSKKQKE